MLPAPPPLYASKSEHPRTGSAPQQGSQTARGAKQQRERVRNGCCCDGREQTPHGSTLHNRFSTPAGKPNCKRGGATEAVSKAMGVVVMIGNTAAQQHTPEQVQKAAGKPNCKRGRGTETVNKAMDCCDGRRTTAHSRTGSEGSRQPDCMRGKTTERMSTELG